MKRIASVLCVIVLSAMLAAMCLPPIAAEPIPGVQIHGYVQNRVYSAEGSNLFYRMERASVSLQAPIGTEATGYTEVYYQPWIPTGTNSEQYRVYLESAYVDFPVGLGRLRAGKGRNLTFGMVPSYPNRKTTNYGIVAETFTQDRIAGFQYYYAKPTYDVAVGAYSSPTLASRGTGSVGSLDPFIPGRTENTVYHLAERDVPADTFNTDRFTASTRVGFKTVNQKLIGGVSLSFGGITQDDLTFINRNTLQNITDTDHTRWGIDATWKPVAPWVFQGEYYGASLGDLDWNAWDVLAGYEPKNKPRFYARYSQYNIDTPAIRVGAAGTPGAAPFGDVTWDQQQLSLSVVFPFKKYKSIWLQLEGELNSENPPAGVGKVDNNIVFVELFTGW